MTLPKLKEHHLQARGTCSLHHRQRRQAGRYYSNCIMFTNLLYIIYLINSKISLIKSYAYVTPCNTICNTTLSPTVQPWASHKKKNTKKPPHREKDPSTREKK